MFALILCCLSWAADVARHCPLQPRPVPVDISPDPIPKKPPQE